MKPTPAKELGERKEVKIMGEVARNLQKEIGSVVEVLNAEKEREGRSEKSRLLAIAVTHLETAKLFVKETENM